MSNSNKDDNAGFLGRWSRRKAAAREGGALPEPERVAPTQPVATASPVAAALADSEEKPPQVGTVPRDVATQSEAQTLTLDDVRTLTTESDFKLFVARDVAPEVRNAAMKKLFADPHFNVMDGLDIYIDDYTKPDPLPASMLARLASAQFLKLVENPDEPEVTDSTEPSASAQTLSESEREIGTECGPEADLMAQHTAENDQQPTDPEGGGDVAPSALCNDLPTPTAPDADPDLRLQSHHAAGRQADRSGAA